MSDLPRDFEYEYRAVFRFDCFTHMWIVHGPKGSLHFHCDDNEKRLAEYGPSSGLEIHYRTPPSYMANRAPNEPQCQILHAPCWHDGTSLYANEALYPLVDFARPLEMFRYLVHEMHRFNEGEEPKS